MYQKRKLHIYFGKEVKRDRNITCGVIQHFYCASNFDIVILLLIFYGFPLILVVANIKSTERGQIVSYSNI